MSFCEATDTPVFGLLVTSALGFKGYSSDYGKFSLRIIYLK